MGTRYFDTIEDNQAIEAGGFFCAGCLQGKAKAEISSDPRYCRECYALICAERKQIRDSHSASMPKLLVDEGQ